MPVDDPCARILDTMAGFRLPFSSTQPGAVSTSHKNDEGTLPLPTKSSGGTLRASALARMTSGSTANERRFFRPKCCTSPTEKATFNLQHRLDDVHEAEVAILGKFMETFLRGFGKGQKVHSHESGRGGELLLLLGL